MPPRKSRCGSRRRHSGPTRAAPSPEVPQLLVVRHRRFSDSDGSERVRQFPDDASPDRPGENRTAAVSRRQQNGATFGNRRVQAPVRPREGGTILRSGARRPPDHRFAKKSSRPLAERHPTASPRPCGFSRPVRPRRFRYAATFGLRNRCPVFSGRHAASLTRDGPTTPLPTFEMPPTRTNSTHRRLSECRPEPDTASVAVRLTQTNSSDDPPVGRDAKPGPTDDTTETNRNTTHHPSAALPAQEPASDGQTVPPPPAGRNLRQRTKVCTGKDNRSHRSGTGPRSPKKSPAKPRSPSATGARYVGKPSRLADTCRPRDGKVDSHLPRPGSVTESSMSRRSKCTKRSTKRR